MLDIENVFYTQVFRTFNIWPLKLTLNFENVQVLTALPQNECQIFKPTKTISNKESMKIP